MSGAPAEKEEASVSFEPRIVLRPRSLDETLDLALVYFRTSARDLFGVSALLVGAASAALLGLGFALHLAVPQAMAVAFWMSPFIEQVMTVYGGRHLFRNDASLLYALGVVARRAPRVALASALISLPWTPALLTGLDDTTWIGIGVILGSFWPMLLASQVYRGEVALLEQLSLARANRRTRSLVDFRFGRALGLVLVGTMLRAMIAGAMWLIVDFALSVLLQFDHVANLMGYTLVIGYLASAPYIAMVRLFDYVDARTRREGWDIQVRFNALVQAGNAKRKLAGPTRARGSAHATIAVLLTGVLAGMLAGSARAEEPGAPTEDLRSAGQRGAEGRKAELATSGYRFCHDPEFGASGTEGASFCAIFDETTDAVCPEARKSCAKWRPTSSVCAPHDDGRRATSTPDDPPGRGPMGAGACPSGEAESRIVVPQRNDRGLLDFTLPRAVGWTLLGLGTAALLFWFYRTLRDAGWERDEVTDAAPELNEAVRNLQALPEARSTTLLGAAARALERRNGAEAAILVHLALLRFLDDEGLARYHPSKTNGDYLRAIRRDAELSSLFRAAARETERIRFGDGACDLDSIRRNLSEAERVLRAGPKARDALAATATALVLVIAFGAACGRPSGHDPAFDLRAPTGLSALPRILRAAGLEVEVVRKRSKISADVGVVIGRTSAADEGSFPEDISVDGLLDRDVTLVLIDDLWQSRYFLPVTSSVSTERGAVDLEVSPPSPRVFCSWSLDGLEAALDGDVARIPRGRRLVDDVATTATVSGSSNTLALQPILSYAGSPSVGDRPAAYAFVADRTDESGTALAGCLYVFADRDLLTNASLTREANARLVSAFFTAIAGNRKIAILDRLDARSFSGEPSDEDGDAKSTSSPARSLEASHMLPLLAQGGITLVLWFVFVGAAFGPLRDPVHREHKAFAEHVDAIGRQYARTGPLGLAHAARALARWVVTRHRDQLRGGASGGWASLAKHLADRHGVDEKDVRAALRLGIDGVSELGAPAPDDPAPSSERMLRTLSRLLATRRARPGP